MKIFSSAPSMGGGHGPTRNFSSAPPKKAEAQKVKKKKGRSSPLTRGGGRGVVIPLEFVIWPARPENDIPLVADSGRVSGNLREDSGDTEDVSHLATYLPWENQHPCQPVSARGTPTA